VLFIEYLVILAFLPYGLIDRNPLTVNIPVANLTFTLSISPVFHLIPIGVSITLLSSWIHITGYIAIMPLKREPTRKLKTKRPISKKIEGKLFLFKRNLRAPRFLKRFFGQLKWRLKRVSQAVKNSFNQLGNILHFTNISSLLRRLNFARASLKGAVITLSVFLTSILALYISGHPTSLYEAAVGLYEASPFLQEFILGVTELAEAITQTFSPIGWLASSINDFVTSLASNFRGTLEPSIAPSLLFLSSLDVFWRYIICQNIAALLSALTTLLYRRIKG